MFRVCPEILEMPVSLEDPVNGENLRSGLKDPGVAQENPGFPVTTVSKE